MNFLITAGKVISVLWEFAISCKSDGTIVFCKYHRMVHLIPESYGPQGCEYGLIDITRSFSDCFSDVAKELHKFLETISHVTLHLNLLIIHLNVM